jgi:hypothetical protein
MFRFVVFFLCTWMSLVQASELVVIRSTQESLLAKGDILDTQAAINLPANAEITVVFESGNTLTLSGPYQGKLTDPAPRAPTPQLVASLSNFIRNNTVVRGETETNDLWSVDVDSSKRYYCVAAGEKINLSRSPNDSKTASTVLLKHKTSDQQVQLTFPANQILIAWPASMLPISYGDTYTLETKTLYGRSSFKKLVLYQLPDNLQTKSHQVMWMVGKGCTSQANMLLVSLR